MMSWDEIKQSSIEQVLDWAEGQSWAQAMAACGQDVEWHAEGDVWTHTRMVVAELERLAEWHSLDSDTRLKLLFTAMFHDAGKPATTTVEPATGRIRSPKHALAGMEIARHGLRELGCPLAFREDIAGLVRYHGRPPYLLEKIDPAREVISISWLADNRLLYLFALADTRGRQAPEMSRPEDNLHLWKMVAEENGCFDQRFAFANDQARFLFYRNALSSLHYVPHEEYRLTVTVMSGLPGAGKDTWLARHQPDLPVVSLDDLRADLDMEPSDNQGAVVQLARERSRELMRAKRSFAFNATNTMRQTRRRWIDLFADYGARVNLVYVEPPLSSVLRQNACRSTPVPERVIQRLVEKLEPPTWGEAHSLTLIG